jgi:hypothetical protein
MDKTHIFFYRYHLSQSQISFSSSFIFLFFFPSSRERKEQKSPSIKSPPTHIFSFVVPQFDLIRLCHINTDTESRTLGEEMLTC